LLYRFWILPIVVIVALAFPTPLMAASDVVDVILSVPELVSIDGGTDVNLTATISDINQRFIFGENASVMTVKCNVSGWTLTASLDSAYTDYALFFEDNKTLGIASGAGFNLIPAAPSSNDMDLFGNYGVAGDLTYNLYWLVTDLS
jgi:hypothetical protein